MSQNKQSNQDTRKGDTWFDLTHTMTWGGGIVGIVRAELELAAGMKKLNPALRFSMLRGDSFVEIPDEDLRWLFDAENAAEAYLVYRGRKPAKSDPTRLMPSVTRNRIVKLVERARAASQSRRDRLNFGIEMIVSAQSKWPRRALRLLTIPTYAALRAGSKVRQFIGAAFRKATPVGVAQASAGNARQGIEHPYADNDIVVCVGWLGSGKEQAFVRVRHDLPTLRLAYLVYDVIIVLPVTRHLYPAMQQQFLQYIEWVSQNADFIFYGGETAQADTRRLQANSYWPSPPSAPLKFGTDIVKPAGQEGDADLVREVGVTGRFIICVGTIEARKNHSTLYKAYVRALEASGGAMPQLVICGRPGLLTSDLLETIRRDPRVRDKIIIVSPTDAQLDALYRRSLFTVLPSLYEGWSLTLPESLSYGKFCLVTDTPPLREIGRDMIDYVPAWDVLEWARKLELYSTDAAALADREARIADGWERTSWVETAAMMTAQLDSGVVRGKSPPDLWFDLTTSYLNWKGGVTGIVRAELSYAQNLILLYPKVRFFASDEGRLFEIERDRLLWLLEDADLSSRLHHFQQFWTHKEAEGSDRRSPFRPIASLPVGVNADGRLDPVHKRRVMAQGAAYVVSALPNKLADPVVGWLEKAFLRTMNVDESASGQAPEMDVFKAPELPDFVKRDNAEFFREESLVLFTGFDNIGPVAASFVDRTIFCSHLIYDFTPVVTPQLQVELAHTVFSQLFAFLSQNFDQIIYGGATAQRDGQVMQKANNWPTAGGVSVRFGSEISRPATASAARIEEVLSWYKIKRPFILAVGTVEPRKNYESLYHAYLTMLDDGVTDMPQLVIAGGAGWLSDDLVSVMGRDKRISDLIIRITPTDEELDVLYRACQFTVLASLYEGWSLTLPESLGYGKFVIVSDVAPLREAGGDFVDYVDPWDVRGWAERILHYTRNPADLAAREGLIKAKWESISWRDATKMLVEAARAGYDEKFPGALPFEISEPSSPTAVGHRRRATKKAVRGTMTKSPSGPDQKVDMP